MKFLIWAWDYSTDSGGGIALHRLAHNLVTLGHEAILSCNKTAEGWLGNPVGPCDKSSRGQIVIYPEIVERNPFYAQRVVRWILNTPGFFGPGNGDGVYGSDDLVMLWDWKYGADLAQRYEIGGLLTAWRDLAHFKDYHRPRAGSCYLVRKSKRQPLDHHAPDALCIDDYSKCGGDNYLIDTFNRVQQLVCYDGNTLIPTLAGLCGVPEIILPCGGGVLTRNKVERATAESIEQTRAFVALCERQWS